MDQYEDIDIFEIDEALPPSKDVVDMDSGFDKLGRFMTTPGNLPYPEFLSPMYKVIAQGTDKVYDFSERLKELGPVNRQMLPGGNIMYMIGQYGIGENIPKTFAKAELGEPITPLEGLEAFLVALDLGGVYAGGKVLAKGAYNNVIKMLSKKGVSEEAAASRATKALVSNPKFIDEYAGAKNVEELSDEAKDKLGVGAALSPNVKTGQDLFEDLGGEVDTVTQNSLLNKFNKQAQLDEVKKKRKPKAQEFVKTLNYEYILNNPDPLKKQQALDVLENHRKGNLKKFEAEKELENIFPEKTGMVGDVNYAFTKLKDNFEDARRRSPKFEEDIFDIYIEPKGGRKPTAKTVNLTDNLIKAADADTSAEPYSVKFLNAYIKQLNPKTKKPSDTSYPFYKNAANAILKFKGRDEVLDIPSSTKGGKGKVFVNEDNTRTVREGARGGDKTAKEMFLEIPDGELVTGYPAQYMKQNISDISGQNYTKAFNSLTKQNSYVADKITDMRQFFEEDLGQYHFYGLDHIQPLRFGGTNSNNNLRFTMEGPHSAVDTLTPNKTLSDIDVKNKSKMEAEIHSVGTDIVDKLYEASRVNDPMVKNKLQQEAQELSKKIKNMTNAFSETYKKVDFHIGEPYVAIKTGNTAKYIKYSDYIGANNETKSLVSDLIPDQFNKPNAGKSIEEQVDEVYTIYADMFNLGGPISKEAMQQMTNFNKGGSVKNFAYGGDVTEDLDIFEAPEDSLPEGSYQTANLMLPFFKLFGKAPPHTTAPIPTPKEKLLNPTKKQKESLETETIKRSTEDIFDPTPNDRINIEESVTTTPITKQPMTSVFYSDVDRLLSRPDTPKTFNSKQEFFDFLNKNNIRKSESMDYRIPQILKLFGDTDPIDTATILTQVRTAPISGMRVHATGQGSEIINPNGAVNVRYSGYAEPGFIEGSQRERILYMNRDKLPGDSGDYPQSMFGGEQVHRHEFQIPNEQDTYIVGWTRLTDRFGFVPPKVEGPQTKINVSKLTKEKTKNERSLQGLYAEARSKIERLANQRGMSQADINDIMIDFGSDLPKLSIIAKYADQLDEISPGLVNQMDELVVKNRELQEQITKGSGVDPSGVVRVTYADEIQSDILQAAAMRKQQLAAALRKIQEEGKQSTNLQGLNRVSEAAINFFEENKSVFRPLEKSPEEMKLLNQQMLRLDEEVDNLVNKYIATRELDDAELAQLGTLLNDNIDKMLNEVMTIDGATMSGLFPDLPLKNREEWADALIKKDLYELAYRKYVLKDPDASDYYATATSNPVIERYGFNGNAATPKELRDIDKQERFDIFKRTGEFKSSKYKGIGMDEFYGGPSAVDEKGKHYTSTIEKILKKQAKENNSEVITMPVQVKKGSKAQYQVTDQNGNMVATLTNEDQARDLIRTNPNYQIKPISIPDKKSMEPVFAIKITEEMLESFATHKAKGGLVSNIDIFEVA
jgi:hypothetical protein